MRQLSVVARRRPARRDSRVLLWLAVGCSLSAHGAEWYTQPTVRTDLESNDNRTLATGSHERVSGIVLDASARLGRRTEIDEFELTPRLRSARYDGTEDIDGDDGYADGLWSRRVTSGDTLALNYSYAHNTTLTTEQADVGLVSVRKRRETTSVKPSWTSVLSERSSLRVAGGSTEIDYQDSEVTDLADYTYDRGDLSWSYQLGANTEGGVALYTSRLEVEEHRNITRDKGIDVNLDGRITETFRATASAGWHRAETQLGLQDGGRLRDIDSGWLAALGVNGGTERTTLAFHLSRTANPSGFGVLVRTDELRASLDHHLSGKTTFVLAARVFRTESLNVLDETLPTDDRRYKLGEASVNWRLSEDWSIDTGYAYRWQRFENASDSAMSRAVRVTLRYIGSRRSVAR